MIRLLPILALIALGCSAASSPTAPTIAAPAPYSRDDWMPSGWIDADHDCQDTRAEVLIEESLIAVTFTSDRRCVVRSGRWLDRYTGQTFTSASDLDVDHLVPLAEAHAAGGWTWAVDERRRFANDLDDPDHLVAVSAAVNRSKGAQTPATWRPLDRSAWCWYGRAWGRIKARWRLSIGDTERAALADLLRAC